MLLTYLLIVMSVLFILGLCGVFLTRKNIIVVLIAIELMLLAANGSLVLFSLHIDDIMGQVYTLLVLTVAAAESAIGLAILVAYHRLRGIIDVDTLRGLKG
jgi:NADH-quinone oxidoreductase subunit K